MMVRPIYISLVAVSISLIPLTTFAQERPSGIREQDSEYVESERTSSNDESGGLFGFLPFLRGQPREGVPSERLVPAPLPEESKPVLSKKKMEQLQAAAERWLLTSEFTEPTLRQNERDRYYRDYIVFSGEYRIEVLRGNAEDKPFFAYIYVKGDYFRTEAHDDPDDAESDFSFEYQPREFRLIFDRVEKWDYSDNADEAPFAFTEQWEFRKFQSRPTVDSSKDARPPDERRATEERDGMPEPAGE
jgi:hypothetical protein